MALAGLAHDIRTPLTGILALADLLHAGDLPAQERRWAAALRDTAQHLARLATVVVDAARSGAAGIALREEVFSPRELAGSLAHTLGARVQAKGLAAHTKIGRGLPRRAIGDSVRLRSAVENLIDNAVKFTERGRVSLTVSGSPASGGRTRLIVELADTGIGMTADEVKRLFRPFTQANDDVGRRFGGAGLGLVLVRRIAEAMGGTLTVASKPGLGTTFRLSVVVRDARDEPPLRKAWAPPKAAGLRILCVEDNPYGRVVLSAMLDALGHRVTFASSAAGALAQVRRGPYDAVLMDVVLPDMDGIEATRRIRMLRGPARNIAIIGLSGRAAPPDEAAARKAGMNEYLRKPATAADLHAALSRIARLPRKKRS